MYGYKFHPEAEKELGKLNHSIQLLFAKKLKQILKSPESGMDLGNKNNLKLSGFKKTYFNGKKHRIVYKVEEEEVLIYIIAVGKREEMEVYKKASERAQS